MRSPKREEEKRLARGNLGYYLKQLDALGYSLRQRGGWPPSEREAGLGHAEVSVTGLDFAEELAEADARRFDHAVATLAWRIVRPSRSRLDRLEVR